MSFLTIMIIVLALIFVVNLACNGWFKMSINVNSDYEDETNPESPADEESRVTMLEGENARLRQENADLAVKLNQREYR